MDNVYYFIDIMPSRLKKLFSLLDSYILEEITEIRFRRNKEIIIYQKDKPFFLSTYGKLTNRPSGESVILYDDELVYITDALCSNSYHTNMQTMINGYVTAPNGSRVGVAGEAVYKNGELKSLRNISSLNIRIARNVKDCSRKILNMIYIDRNPSIIIAGPPGCGKTTLLRDFSSILSSGFAGKFRKIAIADERNEISAGFDTGINCDVISSFDKAKGIEIAVRTMSPEIVICDEIGNEKELESIKFGFSCGVSFILSVHLRAPENFFRNNICKGLLKTGEFDYMVFLDKPGADFTILDLSEV